jgi:uncharacterized protein
MRYQLHEPTCPKNTFSIDRYMRLLLLLISGSLAMSINMAFARIPDAPNPQTMVTDLAGILAQDQRFALEAKLTEYGNMHGTQIAIVTISDLEGMAPAEFADQLAENWGIGQAGRENGVLILVNPPEGDSRGNVHISVGYGLEGVIPDLAAKRVVDREIFPNFRENRYFEGLDQATTVLMQLAAGEFPASDYIRPAVPDYSGFLVLGIFVIIFLFSLSGKRRSHYSPGRQIPMWTLLMMMGGAGRGSRGSWGSFSSGGGAFRGGFGGRGFGGFGGGSFGGGGAGGSW